MIGHSPLYEEASRYSNTMSTVVDVYRGATLVYPNVPVIAGTVKCDRGSKVRWTAKVDIGLYPWEFLPLVDIAKSRFIVKRGITSLGYTEMLQLGEYRINEIGRSEHGRISIDGAGLESYVIDARFLSPRVPPYGTSTVAAIAGLIQEAVPHIRPVVFQGTRDKLVTATSPWDRDRMDAVLQLGDSLGADVFCDHSGQFVIVDSPALRTGIPVFRVDAGTGGLLVSETSGDTRSGLYNAVSVTGRSPDAGQLPVWGWAYDSDATSPTYFYGDFGQRPTFYSSQYLATTAQCTAAAQNLLAESLSANRSLSFTQPAVCFLEAGDVVTVLHGDGTAANYLLQSVTIGLDDGGTLAADTSVALP